MNIKLLEPSDAESYWTLRLEALSQHPEAFSTSYEEAVTRENPVEKTAENFSNEGNYTFGAFNKDDELIGVVTLLQERQLKLNHKANIVAMYVHPGSRHSGVGRALLSEAIHKALSINGIEKLNLTVVTTNKMAKKLYMNLGFKTFGLEEKSLKINGKYYDEEYMALYLNKPIYN